MFEQKEISFQKMHVFFSNKVEYEGFDGPTSDFDSDTDT